MAKYVWQASGADNSTPVGLTAYGDGVSTDWKIATVASQKAVTAYRAGSGTGLFGASLDAAATDSGRADAEIWLRYYRGNATGLAFVRGSGGAGTESAYALKGSINGKTSQPLFNIQAYYSNTFVGYSNVTKSSSWTSTSILQARFRVSGTTVQFRVWLDTDAEPSTWDQTLTDTNVSGVGLVGIASASISAAFSVFSFGVGTGGDSAPTSAVSAITAPDALSLSDAVSVAASVPVDDTLSLSEDLSVFKTVSQVLSVALFKTLQRSVKTAPVCRKMEAYARQVSVSLGLSQKSAQASPTFRRAIFTLE